MFRAMLEWRIANMLFWLDDHVNHCLPDWWQNTYVSYWFCNRVTIWLSKLEDQLDLVEPQMLSLDDDEDIATMLWVDISQGYTWHEMLEKRERQANGWHYGWPIVEEDY